MGVHVAEALHIGRKESFLQHPGGTERRHKIKTNKSSVQVLVDQKMGSFVGNVWLIETMGPVSQLHRREKWREMRKLRIFNF